MRSTTAPPRVLIVEDDPAARGTLTAILSAEDCQVEAVADVGSAEAALREQQFDVVVTDYQLRSDSGMEILRFLPERHPGVTGILVTGHPDRPEVQEAQQNWRDFTVLFKPYDPDVLLRAVKNATTIARVRQGSLRLAKLR